MLSEDGLWEWNGQSWIPAPASDPIATNTPSPLHPLNNQSSGEIDENNLGFWGYIILIACVLSLPFHVYFFFGLLLGLAAIISAIVWRIVASVSCILIRRYAMSIPKKENIMIRFDTERRVLNKLRGKEKLFSSVHFCLSPLAITFFVIVHLMSGNIGGGISSTDDILGVRGALVWFFSPIIGSAALLFRQLRDLGIYRVTNARTLLPIGDKITGIAGGALGIGIMLPIIQTVWTGGNLDSGFSPSSAFMMLFLWFLLFMTSITQMLIASFVHINVHRSIVNNLRNEIIHSTSVQAYDFEFNNEDRAIRIVVSEATE